MSFQCAWKEGVLRRKITIEIREKKSIDKKTGRGKQKERVGIEKKNG